MIQKERKGRFIDRFLIVYKSGEIHLIQYQIILLGSLEKLFDFVYGKVPWLHLRKSSLTSNQSKTPWLLLNPKLLDFFSIQHSLTPNQSLTPKMSSSFLVQMVLLVCFLMAALSNAQYMSNSYGQQFAQWPSYGSYRGYSSGPDTRAYLYSEFTGNGY